jgi:ribose 1,5-bisphosphokinase
MSGKIIALVGPSGVGKNYAKQAIKDKYPELVELTVYTTRARRSSDGVDRKADIAISEFLRLKQEEEIIGAHQPFGSEGDWYGFSQKQIDEMLDDDSLILTEIHPDNISLFKKLYEDTVFIVALTAENDYLEHNLKSRGSEKEAERTIRLDRAFDEMNTIKKMQEEKLVDKVIEVGWDNRDELSEIAIKSVSQEIEPLLERENILQIK